MSARRPYDDRMLAAFLKACPTGARLFEDDVIAGIRAALAEDGLQDVKHLVRPSKAKEIIVQVATDHGLTWKQMRDPFREKRRVSARKAAADALRAAGYSTTEVGIALNRDHSTIVQYRKPKARAA